ncbi:MAG: HAMP domain-containing histidine kinase [Betaproteobacteria bacterium]|nr:HAMP domain-containing histidine kinase [Betaproteobacteria bacterium]
MSDPTPEPKRRELRYPRSFLVLLLAGFVIVALPLILGLIADAISIEKLAGQSQRAVYDAVRVTHGVRRIDLPLQAMHAAATVDPPALPAYEKARTEFVAALDVLSPLTLADDMRTEVAALRSAENGTKASLSEADKQLRVRNVEAGFSEMTRATQSLATMANQAIGNEVDALRLYADRAGNRVFWQILSMIPAAILMIAGYIYLLMRPIQDLDKAITRLGQGKLAQKIRISGPHDIEQLGRQLDWLRTRLIELEDQKTRFFQHVSHELKTPLTALREGSDLLNDEIIGKLNEEQREVATILRQSSITLEKLIQDLLTYSQSLTGRSLERKTAMEVSAIELQDLVDEVIDTHKLAMTGRAITVKRDYQPTRIQGDRTKLRVVFDNLFSNAIKYSPNDSVISVKVSGDSGNAQVDVVDQGAGIAETDRERVFEPFFRGTSTTAAKGTGLGLAIASDLADMHGGKILLMPAAATANGSHFRVMLPQAPR